MDKLFTPIYDALMEYAGSGTLPFHMPGHKLGRGLPSWFKDRLASLDVTEIPGTDNLHFPEGPIAQAQERAAEVFGADSTFFLVNGSTCGIHAMIMTLCRPGDKLIVARDCHKSVIGGMLLAGAEPVYVSPSATPAFGIPGALAPDSIRRALEAHPDAAGVLLTRPSYYGICSGLQEIARICHAHGKVLAVDEAHGAHLAFNRRLPLPALEAGADLCVQSAHKTLPALTQGAYLHVRSALVDKELLQFNLRLLQTSSPSYIIMASLDIARALMETEGKERLDGLLDSAAVLRKKLGAIKGLRMLGPDDIEEGSLDETRLVINVQGLGITGFDADRILRSDHGIQVEMSDLYNLVCIATVSDTQVQMESLAAALEKLAAEMQGRKTSESRIISESAVNIAPGSGCGAGIPFGRRVMGLRDAALAKHETVPLDKASGRICSGIVTPYPPGIPALCPGELIEPSMVEYIYNILGAGGIVNGLIGKNCIQVVL